MYTLILINQCLLNGAFRMTKALNGESSPKQNFHSLHLSVLFGHSTYVIIKKTMWPPIYHQNGFVVT